MDKRRKKERRKRRDQKVKSRVRAAQLAQVRAAAARPAGAGQQAGAGSGGLLCCFCLPVSRHTLPPLPACNMLPLLATHTCPDLCPPSPPPSPLTRQAEGIGEDTGPEQLFSLSKLKGQAGKTLGTAAAPDFDAPPGTSSSEGEEDVSGSGSEMDSEDEQRRWAAAVGPWIMPPGAPRAVRLPFEASTTSGAVPVPGMSPAAPPSWFPGLCSDGITWQAALPVGAAPGRGSSGLHLPRQPTPMVLPVPRLCPYRWYCRYDAMMDEYLEDSYQAWKQRQRIKGDIVKKRRRRIGDAGELRQAARGWGERQMADASLGAACL